MSKLSTKDAIPLNALLWTTFLTIALGAISIGSSTAMNAILGSAALCLVTSYIAAFGLCLYRGRQTLNQDRWFSLGRFGTPLMAIAIVWCLFLMVILSVPLYLPVTPQTMNYTSVVFAGFCALSGLYWIFVFSKNKASGEHHAHGPETHVAGRDRI